MRVIRELRELISFVLSLWGVLTLASAFLPLANQFSQVVVFPEAQMNIATGLASLTCLFAFLFSFAERHRLRPNSYRPAVVGFTGQDPDSTALRSALERFGWALGLLALYLILQIIRGRLVSDSGDVQQLLAALMPPLLLIVYSALFGLLTAAFGELAVIEHVRSQELEETKGFVAAEGRH